MAAVAVLAASAGAAAQVQPQVRAELVADAARLVPGSVVHVGVRLEIAPGWHVYWRNPGNAGLATAVEVEAPEGLTPGALEWPAPAEFDQPGGIVGYGYENEVLLARPLTVSASAPPAAAPVTVRASWLACRERCVLGDATLRASLPVPDAEAARARALLKQWRRRLPAPAAAGPRATVRGGLGSGGQEGAVTMWLQWRRPPGEVSWFPAPTEGLEIRDVRVRTRGDRTRIDFTAAPRAGQGTPEAVLASVVVARGRGRESEGFALPVPLTATGG